jgi:hypothetical protein
LVELVGLGLQNLREFGKLRGFSAANRVRRANQLSDVDFCILSLTPFMCWENSVDSFFGGPFGLATANRVSLASDEDFHLAFTPTRIGLANQPSVEDFLPRIPSLSTALKRILFFFYSLFWWSFWVC